MSRRVLPVLLLAWRLCFGQDAGKTTTPVLIHKVEPQYTDKARSAHISGRSLLSVVIDENGVPRDIKVISPLPDGLEEKAIEAVSQWRFKPATRNGVAISTKAQVEVNFRLCEGDCGANPDFERLEGARTIYNGAIHQLSGDIDKKDEMAGFRAMERAALMGYRPAETILGQLFLDGTGTAPDVAKAAEWFDRAAFHGSADGEYELGGLYRIGKGVPHDPARAYSLFMKAAAQDQIYAEYAVGLALETGDGVTENLTEAEKWYRKSAEHGAALAQYRLAKLYSSGSAGKQDQVKALMWALLAQKGGSGDAAAMVQQCRNGMDASHIAQAEEQAARFKPRPSKWKP